MKKYKLVFTRPKETKKISLLFHKNPFYYFSEPIGFTGLMLSIINVHFCQFFRDDFSARQCTSEVDAGIDLWQENLAKADILTFCRKFCEKIPEKLFVPRSWRPIDTCPASSNIALSHYRALPACLRGLSPLQAVYFDFFNCRPEMLWKRMKKVCLNFLVVIEVCQIGKTGLCCKLWCLSPGNCSHQLMPP